MEIKTSNRARKLRIAQIAPLWYALPPKKYAGVERVAGNLTEELVKRGHDVTLFASGDSKTSAKLLSIRNRCLVKDKISWTDVLWDLENLSFAFKKAGDFDIIHSHIGLRALFFQDLVKTPTIHTFHNPDYVKAKKNSPRLQILKNHFPDSNICFLSNDAKKSCPIELNRSRVVYNGVDTELFKFNAKPKDYYFWVGRFDYYKGVETAVQVAKKLGLKLYLAGKIDSGKKEYFDSKIKPFLSENIKYLGEVAQKDLPELYANAKALIFPIEWREPFGLTMIEAQSCGTPVIVFDLGSAPEIVKDCKTGFVVPFLDKQKNKNIEGIMQAVGRIDQIKREDCRSWIEKNFTLQKMADNYEKAYYEISKRK